MSVDAYLFRAKLLVRRLTLGASRLRRRLPSGLEVTVRDHSDWIIYNDLFVDGEYDEPIVDLLERAPHGPWRVVDLGANVGFFILRLADLALRRGLALEPLELTAVEGHPRVFRTLQRRLAANPRVQAQCRLLQGLVGERSGQARIVDSGFSATANVPSGQQREQGIFRLRGSRVPYLDLLGQLRSSERIDLLKCDIEGAEELFLRNYPEILGRVDSAVLEFHLERCDLDRCHALLAAAGLERFTTLSQRGGLAVRWYRRD